MELELPCSQEDRMTRSRMVKMGYPLCQVIILRNLKSIPDTALAVDRVSRLVAGSLLRLYRLDGRLDAWKVTLCFDDAV